MKLKFLICSTNLYCNLYFFLAIYKILEDVFENIHTAGFITSFAIVVMKAAGRTIAIEVRACLAVRQESAAGVKGRPYVILKPKNTFVITHIFFFLISNKFRNNR